MVMTRMGIISRKKNREPIKQLLMNYALAFFRRDDIFFNREIGVE